MYLRTFEICLAAPGLAWQGSLRKTKVKLSLLTDIDLLLMVEKESEVEYIMLFTDMQKLKASTLKAMIKVKNNHIFSIGT